MGLFSKKPRPAPPADKTNDDVNPVQLATAAILATGDAAVGLALVINELLVHDLIDAQGLAKVGISQDEVQAIVAAYDRANTHEEFDYALETYAALRQYNAELVTIAGERGVSTSSEQYTALRSAIAGFADQNDIYDLRVAYRLMLAECPERLPGHKA